MALRADDLARHVVRRDVRPRREAVLTFAGLLALALGFGLAFPFPLGVAGLRLTDLAALSAAGLAVVSLLAGKLIGRALLFYFAVAVFTLPWVAAELFFPLFHLNSPPAAMILVRWIVALPAAYLIATLSEDRSWRQMFLLGFLLGLFADVATLAYDYLVFEATGRPPFATETASIAWAEGGYRAGGILGHANGAAIACLFIVPILIGLNEEFRWGFWTLMLAVLGSGAVFFLTQTRSALLSAAALLFWHLLSVWPRAVVGAGLVGAAIGMAMLAVSAGGSSGGDGPVDALLNRLFASEGASENAAGRLDTLLGAVGLALDYPLGMGSAHGPALHAQTGFEETHNAFLQLALLGGLPLTAVVGGALFLGVLRAFRRPRPTEAWLAVYFVLVSMFETILFNPLVPPLVLWLLWRSIVLYRDRERGTQHGG